MSEAKERSQPLFSFDFNRSVKVRSEAPTITSNAGVLLLRELDHKLAAVETLAGELHDPRAPERVRYSLTELLRERLYAIALGYSRQDDADMLAHDPAFKTAVWDKAGAQVADERLASQPTASRTINILAGWHNREALRDNLHIPVLRHQRQSGDNRKVALGVVDVDGFPIETYGEQQGAAYNGHYGKTVYSPLVAFFSSNGTFDAARLGEGFLHAALREGNASAAEGAELFLDDAVDKARELAQTVAFRLDAGFAGAKILNRLNARGVRFTVRLPSNPALEECAAPFLTRPSGRPPKDGREFAVELTGYQNPKWDKPYRVVLVVVDKPGKDGCLALFPHHFFIVTNWRPERLCAWEVVKHYRQRGTFEDRLGEWNALGVNLSQGNFAQNEVTLLLSLFAFNLLEALRGEIESATDPREEPPAKAEGAGFDMTRLRTIVLKVGGVLTRGGRRLLFDLAEGVAPLWQAVLTRLNKLLPCEQAVSLPQSNSFVPPPSHSFLRFTPRM